MDGGAGVEYLGIGKEGIGGTFDEGAGVYDLMDGVCERDVWEYDEECECEVGKGGAGVCERCGIDVDAEEEPGPGVCEREGMDADADDDPGPGV